MIASIRLFETKASSASSPDVSLRKRLVLGSSGAVIRDRCRAGCGVLRLEQLAQGACALGPFGHRRNDLVRQVGKSLRVTPQNRPAGARSGRISAPVVSHQSSSSKRSRNGKAQTDGTVVASPAGGEHQAAAAGARLRVRLECQGGFKPRRHAVERHVFDAFSTRLRMRLTWPGAQSRPPAGVSMRRAIKARASSPNDEQPAARTASI